MNTFITLPTYLSAHAPDVPVYVFRPHKAQHMATHFVTHFNGDVLYAVKANPHPIVLKALSHGGVHHFDVASLNEAKHVRSLLPEAHLYFMHPVKSETAIYETATMGLRHFVVDHRDELDKIIVGTRDHVDPRHITIIIRLCTAKGVAVYDLGGKFGTSVAEAIALSQAARHAGFQVGYSFHVGSQCLAPSAYVKAILLIGDVVRAVGLPPTIIDIGGGFPVAYRHTQPPPLSAYCAAVQEGLDTLGLENTPRLLCEPGRALAAEAASLLVRVVLRRGHQLYLNDGMYGGLSELRHSGLDVPMRVWRRGGTGIVQPVTTPIDDFVFCGPTCDSADILQGPFALPATIRNGDYIEMDLMGAYSLTLRSDFNGFKDADIITVGEEGT